MTHTKYFTNHLILFNNQQWTLHTISMAASNLVRTVRFYCHDIERDIDLSSRHGERMARRSSPPMARRLSPIRSSSVLGCGAPSYWERRSTACSRSVGRTSTGSSWPSRRSFLNAPLPSSSPMVPPTEPRTEAQRDIIFSSTTGARPRPNTNHRRRVSGSSGVVHPPRSQCLWLAFAKPIARVFLYWLGNRKHSSSLSNELPGLKGSGCAITM